MKKNRIASVLTAMLTATFLVAATAGTAAAAPTKQTANEQQGLFGKVVEVTETGLIVETKDGRVEVSVTETTQYRAPDNDGLQLSEISPGDRFAALVNRQDALTVAVTVMIVPSQGRTVHITGVVAEIEDGIAVIVTEDERRISAEFGLNGNIPEAGAVVTIVGKLDPATNTVRVRSVQLVSKTLLRLRNHITQIREIASDEKTEIKHVSRVREALERVSTRQLEAVNKVIDRLPESARGALDEAVHDLETANQAVAEALDRVLLLAAEQEDSDVEIERSKARRLPKEVKPSLEDVASALNITVDELAQRLSNGAKLVQVIEETGITKEEFQVKISVIVLGRLQALVDEQRLTQEAFDLITAEIDSLVAHLIDDVFERDETVHPELPVSISDIARVLDMEPSELVSLLHNGHTIAEIATRNGVSRDRLEEALIQLTRKRLQKLIEEGVVQPQDLDRLLNEVRERITQRVGEVRRADPQPERGRPPEERQRSVSALDLKLIARILGVSEEQLVNRLSSGALLPDIAQEQGVTVDNLVHKLTAAMRNKLAELVESGDIDEARAKRLLDEATERLVKSLRQYQHSVAQTERKQGHVRSASENVYRGAPVTVEDLANAIGVSVEELHDWLGRDRGLLALLKERNIQPEALVEALINVAASRLRNSASGNVPTEQVKKVLAELRHRLIADLDLTQKARPRVTEERPQARPVAFVPFDIRVISRALKIEVTELRRMLAAGHTVQEIAQARGVTLEQVVRAVIETLELELRKAVQDGRISEEDARKKLANAEESLRKALQSFRMAQRSDEHRDEEKARPELRPARDHVPVQVNAQTVARALGITPEDLHTLITQGVTLPQIAKPKRVYSGRRGKAPLGPCQSGVGLSS